MDTAYPDISRPIAPRCAVPPIRHFHPGRQRVKRCLLLARACVAAGLASILVRITVRDAALGFDTFFYMTPLPVVAGVFLAAAVTYSVAGRRLAGLGCGAAGAAMLLWFHQANWRPGPGRSAGTPGAAARVVFWNLAGGGGGLTRCGERLRGFEAEIIGLVEGRIRGEWNDRWLTDTLPNYRLTFGYEQMVIATRGPVRDVDTHALGDGSRCLTVLYECNGQPVRIALVDISHSVFRSRRKPIERLARLVEEWRAETPVLIGGDFNTPVDSVLLEPLRRLCRNAFEAAGDGYPTTWPMPLAVLSLDQIWVSPELRPARCRAEWTIVSDHRPMVLELSTTVREPADNRARESR